MKSLLAAIATAAAFLCDARTARAEDLPVVAWQGRTMGSDYVVKIAGRTLPPDRVDALKAEVEQRLVEINRQMSHYQPDSELSRFNRLGANTPFTISDEFAQVVRFTLDLSRLSDGALDPTLAPVLNLWGFGEKTSQRRVPSTEALATAMASVGWQHVSLTPTGQLQKNLPGLGLNLSAVAKGFGVDQMIAILQRHGLTNAYAAIAGEVRVLGHNSRRLPWQVGIASPAPHWNEKDPVAAVVALSNQAISTSGDYQQFFTDSDGRRLSHILDPRTGRPVQHLVTGVSVVAPDSMTADALGTVLFVLGEEAGLRFIEAWTNAAALFIVRDAPDRFRQLTSSRFARMTNWQPER